MKRRALAYLVCPDCHESLTLSVANAYDDEVLEGNLSCSRCAGSYPIVRGIPRFCAEECGAESQSRMRQRFGWQARRFRTRGFGTADSGGEFGSFVSPLDKADFEGQVVMEAGCGTGRWAVTAANWGARDVLAIDFSDAVEAAHENAKGLPNLHVIQADLYRLPLRRENAGQVDLAMSIGVLHHLEDSMRGLRALAAATRPGGTVFSWVYAAEGNQWLARVVSPVRARLTSRLPPPVVFALALVLGAVVHPVAKAVRGLLPARVFFGYRPYFEWLARLPFRHTHAVIHDYLATPLTRYVTRRDFESWFRDSGLIEPRIRHRNRNRNRNSWSGFAQRRLARGCLP